MSRYRTLRAPFSGVVTQRYADPGALVQNAATNQVSALPVVTISDTSRLKVSVYVEQGEAPNVKPGLDAEIVDASNAERRGKGKVTRIAGELDPRTRTLLTEVDFDNSKGQFVAGQLRQRQPSGSGHQLPGGARTGADHARQERRWWPLSERTTG